MGQSKINQKVKELRQEIVDSTAMSFVDKFNPETESKRLSNSYLAEHLEVFPSEYSLEILSFTLSIVETGIERLIGDVENPRDLLFISSKLVELCHQEFIDPRTGRCIKYLGSSKNKGYFFTPPEVAEKMADDLLADMVSTELDVLDPAIGMGALGGMVIILAKERNQTIDSLTGIELDSFTARLAETVLNEICKLINSKTKVIIHNGDALDILTNNILNKTYGYIIANPPYGRIKFLKSSLTNSETKTSTATLSIDSQEQKAKELVNHTKSKILSLSSSLGVKTGLNEYYRVFLLLSLQKLSLNGRLVFISPSTWLGDRESYELRKLLVQNKWIRGITLYQESVALFATVNQSTVVATIDKSPADNFKLSHASGKHLERIISFETIETNEPELLRIPRLKPEDLEIFNKLKLLPTVSMTADLACRRGEIDLTLDKGLLTSNVTGNRLVRGNDIERYSTIVDPLAPHVNVQGNKAQLAKYFRIAGRQVSYLDKKRRLSFSIVEPGMSLGNSCNYIVFNQGADISDRMLSTLGMLNSIVLEWFFRIFNSNNHVANFEIGTFPLPQLDDELTSTISKSTEFLINTYAGRPDKSKAPNELEDLHEALVAFAFHLTSAEMGSITNYIDPSRADRISNMLTMLHEGISPRQIAKSNKWYDHYPPTLSELDRTMIKHIPQGGNWSSIPDDVPSQRVAQIKEMSKERGVVRTTYYGRLKPDQPSYTIATSFNRPGNGTNIHPWEDRTITTREAARLQSFPDSYIFLGNEGRVRTQIGNAVPPLLGYAVGKQIAKESQAGLSIDAFAGAGGLSIGLEMAGFESISGLDNDKASAQTYRFNRPFSEDVAAKNKGLFIEGDLSDPELFDEAISKIKTKLDGRQLELLAGGPPCQGFSHAGFRRQGDKRNNLASIYLKMAEQLNPNTVLLENVEGLLSFNKGQVLKDLLITLSELGYKTDGAPWVLCAEEYGAPQMRRRVFIVVNKDKVITPPKKLYQKCLGRREDAAKLALNGFDLPYPHTAAEALIDLSSEADRTINDMGIRPIRNEYSEWLKGFIDPETLLSS